MKLDGKLQLLSPEKGFFELVRLVCLLLLCYLVECASEKRAQTVENGPKTIKNGQITPVHERKRAGCTTVYHGVPRFFDLCGTPQSFEFIDRGPWIMGGVPSVPLVQVTTLE